MPKRRKLLLIMVSVLVLVAVSVTLVVVLPRGADMEYYQTLYLQGNFADCRRGLLKRLAKEPDWHQARELLIQVELADNQPIAALEHLLFLMEADRGTTWDDHVFTAIIDAGEPARIFIDKELAARPNLSRLRAIAARLDIAGNKPVQALQHIILLVEQGVEVGELETQLLKANLDIMDELNACIIANPDLLWAKLFKLQFGIYHKNQDLVMSTLVELAESDTDIPRELAQISWDYLSGQQSLYLVEELLELAQLMERSDWVDDVLNFLAHKTFNWAEPNAQVQAMLPRLMELVPNEPRLLKVKSDLAGHILESLEILLEIKALGHEDDNLKDEIVFKILAARADGIVGFLNKHELPRDVEDELAKRVALFPSMYDRYFWVDTPASTFDHLIPFVKHNDEYKLYNGVYLMSKGEKDSARIIFAELQNNVQYAKLARELAQGYIVNVVKLRSLRFNPDYQSWLYLTSSDGGILYRQDRSVYTFEEATGELNLLGTLELATPLVWSPTGDYAWQYTYNLEDSMFIIYDGNLNIIDEIVTEFETEDDVWYYAFEDFPVSVNWVEDGNMLLYRGGLRNWRGAIPWHTKIDLLYDCQNRQLVQDFDPDQFGPMSEDRFSPVVNLSPKELEDFQELGLLFAVGKEYVYTKRQVADNLLVLTKFNFSGELISQLPFYWVAGVVDFSFMDHMGPWSHYAYFPGDYGAR